MQIPNEEPLDGEASNDSAMIAQIIAEFSEAFAFARNRWSGYANEAHPDLTGAGMLVLQSVLKQGPVTATGISQMLTMDKAFVSRQISHLRELGLVEAQPSPDDRRVVLLTPTPGAAALIERMRQRWAQVYHERFADWDHDALERLRDSLHRFNASVPAPAHCGGPPPAHDA